MSDSKAMFFYYTMMLPDNVWVLSPLLIFQWLCIHQERGQGTMNSSLHPFLSYFALFSMQSLLKDRLFIPSSVSRPLPQITRTSFLSRKPELAPHRVYCQNRTHFGIHTISPYSFSLATGFLINLNLIPVSFIPLPYFGSLSEPLLISPWHLKTFFPHSFANDILL